MHSNASGLVLNNWQFFYDFVSSKTLWWMNIPKATHESPGIHLHLFFRHSFGTFIIFFTEDFVSCRLLFCSVSAAWTCSITNHTFHRTNDLNGWIEWPYIFCDRIVWPWKRVTYSRMQLNFKIYYPNILNSRCMFGEARGRCNYNKFVAWLQLHRERKQKSSINPLPLFTTIMWNLLTNFSCSLPLSDHPSSSLKRSARKNIEFGNTFVTCVYVGLQSEIRNWTYPTMTNN